MRAPAYARFSPCLFSFSGRAQLSYCNFADANLGASGLQMTKWLSGEANLTASSLQHARFLRASMDGAQLGQVKAQDADFSEASLNGP